MGEWQALICSVLDYHVYPKWSNVLLHIYSANAPAPRVKHSRKMNKIILINLKRRVGEGKAEK